MAMAMAVGVSARLLAEGFGMDDCLVPHRVWEAKLIMMKFVD
jgi:hypothetical protein